LPILLLRKRKLRHSLGKPSRSDFVQLEVMGDDRFSSENIRIENYNTGVVISGPSYQTFPWKVETPDWVIAQGKELKYNIMATTQEVPGMLQGGFNKGHILFKGEKTVEVYR